MLIEERNHCFMHYFGVKTLSEMPCSPPLKQPGYGTRLDAEKANRSAARAAAGTAELQKQSEAELGAEKASRMLRKEFDAEKATRGAARGAAAMVALAKQQSDQAPQPTPF